MRNRELRDPRVLAPSLTPGRVVVMDDLGAHRPKRVRELIEEKGCQLLYLPSYSPDYNPIEEAFRQDQGPAAQGLRREQGGALVEAIAVALSAVTAQDVLGFLEHAEYRTTAHLL